MNKFRRICSLALLFVFLMIGVVGVSEEIEPYASELIGSKSISRSIDSEGRIKVRADVTTLGTVDKLGLNKLQIQEYYGGNWVVVASVTNKFGYNVSLYGYTLYYSNPVEGRSYRGHAEYYAQDGSISDTKTLTSSSLTY